MGFPGYQIQQGVHTQNCTAPSASQREAIVPCPYGAASISVCVSLLHCSLQGDAAAEDYDGEDELAAAAAAGYGSNADAAAAGSSDEQLGSDEGGSSGSDGEGEEDEGEEESDDLDDDRHR